MSICSQEVSCISEHSKFQAGYASITEITDDRPASPIPFKREPLNPKLIRTVKQTALKHSSEKLETKPKRVNSEPSRKSPDPKSDSHRPHEIKSLLVDASIVRSLSPVQVVVFPPELPPMLPVRPRSATPKKCEPGSPAKIPDSKRSKSPKGKKIKEGNICSKVEASVNVKRQVDKIESVHYNQQVEKKATSIRDLPKPTMQSGAMASALATASDKPFRPNIIKERALVPTGKVGLPPETLPYFPPEHGDKDEKVAQALREVRCKSPMTDMLTTASSRPYSPLPSVTQMSSVSNTSSMANSSVMNISSTTTSSVTNVGFHPIRKPVSMISALTVAPKIPFTVPGKTPVPSESLPVPSAFKPVTPTSPTFVPVPGRPHSPMKYYPAYTKIPQPSPPTVIARGEFTDKEHIKYDTTIKPHSPKPVTCTTVKESTKTTGKTDTLKTKQVMQLSQSETYLLPYYQQNIGEIPIRRSISPIRQIKAPSYSPAEQMLHPPPSVRQMSQTKCNTTFKVQHDVDVKKDTCSLKAPNLIPHYQQNIGEIPVRNRSISPVPHPIRAPSCEPKVIPSPKNYSTSSISGVPIHSYRHSPTHTFKSIQTQTEIPQIKQIKEVIKESISENTKHLSKEEKEVHKSVTKISQGVVRPASPSTWNAKVEKTVQNLSPITVRIPSPIPKPLGHTHESVGSNIHITHHRDHTSTVSVTPIPDENNNMQDAKGKPWSKSSTPTSFKESPLVKPSGKVGGSTGKHVSYNLNNIVSSSGKQVAFQTQQCKPLTTKTTTQVNVQKTSAAQGQKTYQEEKTSSVMTKQMHDERYLVNKTSTQASSEGHSTAISNISKLSALCEKDVSAFPTATSCSKSCMSQKSSSTCSPSSTRVNPVAGEKNSIHTENKGVLSSIKPSCHSETVVSSLSQQSYAKEKHVTGDSKTVKKTVVSNNSKSDGSGRFPSQSLLSLGGSSSGGNGTGGGAGGKGAMAGTTAPRRGRGVLNPNTGPQARIPLCGHCNKQIRGPFITALGKIWCPEHFICVNAQCHRPLQDIGFVEEQEGLYCEFCFEKYLAPNCSKCNIKIKGDCLNAIGKQFHPECFCCTYCGKMFGNNPFFLEDALPYCETDWNELFTTKCFACGFPIEAGDRWVEALSNNYHSQCFNCTMCKKNLEGQSFFAKGGRPFCKNHAR